MRPSRTRDERKNQAALQPTEDELTLENRKQAELKKKEKMLEALNNQKELLKHYENNVGGDREGSELAEFVNQKKAELEARARELEEHDPVFQSLKEKQDQEREKERAAALAKHKKKDEDIFQDMFFQNTKDENGLRFVSNGELEREKRLKLREQERMRRLAGGDGSVYDANPQKKLFEQDVGPKNDAKPPMKSKLSELLPSGGNQGVDDFFKQIERGGRGDQVPYGGGGVRDSQERKGPLRKEQPDIFASEEQQQPAYTKPNPFAKLSVEERIEAQKKNEPIAVITFDNADSNPYGYQNQHSDKQDMYQDFYKQKSNTPMAQNAGGDFSPFGGGGQRQGRPISALESNRLPNIQQRGTNSSNSNLLPPKKDLSEDQIAKLEKQRQYREYLDSQVQQKKRSGSARPGNRDRDGYQISESPGYNQPPLVRTPSSDYGANNNDSFSKKRAYADELMKQITEKERERRNSLSGMQDQRIQLQSYQPHSYNEMPPAYDSTPKRNGFAYGQPAIEDPKKLAELEKKRKYKEELDQQVRERQLQAQSQPDQQGRRSSKLAGRLRQEIRGAEMLEYDPRANNPYEYNNVVQNTEQNYPSYNDLNANPYDSYQPQQQFPPQQQQFPPQQQYFQQQQQPQQQFQGREGRQRAPIEPKQGSVFDQLEQDNEARKQRERMQKQQMQEELKRQMQEKEEQKRLEKQRLEEEEFREMQKIQREQEEMERRDREREMLAKQKTDMFGNATNPQNTEFVHQVQSRRRRANRANDEDGSTREPENNQVTRATVINAEIKQVTFPNEEEQEPNMQSSQPQARNRRRDDLFSKDDDDGPRKILSNFSGQSQRNNFEVNEQPRTETNPWQQLMGQQQFPQNPQMPQMGSFGAGSPNMMMNMMGMPMPYFPFPYPFPMYGQMPGQMGGQIPGQMGGQMPGQMGGQGGYPMISKEELEQQRENLRMIEEQKVLLNNMANEEREVLDECMKKIAAARLEKLKFEAEIEKLKELLKQNPKLNSNLFESMIANSKKDHKNFDRQIFATQALLQQSQLTHVKSDDKLHKLKPSLAKSQLSEDPYAIPLHMQSSNLFFPGALRKQLEEKEDAETINTDEKPDHGLLRNQQTKGFLEVPTDQLHAMPNDSMMSTMRPLAANTFLVDRDVEQFQKSFLRDLEAYKELQQEAFNQDPQNVPHPDVDKNEYPELNKKKTNMPSQSIQDTLQMPEDHGVTKSYNKPTNKWMTRQSNISEPGVHNDNEGGLVVHKITVKQTMPGVSSFEDDGDETRRSLHPNLLAESNKQSIMISENFQGGQMAMLARPKIVVNSVPVSGNKNMLARTQELSAEMGDSNNFNENQGYGVRDSQADTVGYNLKASQAETEGEPFGPSINLADNTEEEFKKEEGDNFVDSTEKELRELRNTLERKSMDRSPHQQGRIFESVLHDKSSMNLDTRRDVSQSYGTRSQRIKIDCSQPNLKNPPQQQQGQREQQIQPDQIIRTEPNKRRSWLDKDRSPLNSNRQETVPSLNDNERIIKSEVENQAGLANATGTQQSWTSQGGKLRKIKTIDPFGKAITHQEDNSTVNHDISLDERTPVNASVKKQANQYAKDEDVLKTKANELRSQQILDRLTNALATFEGEIVGIETGDASKMIDETEQDIGDIEEMEESWEEQPNSGAQTGIFKPFGTRGHSGRYLNQKNNISLDQ